MKMTQKLVPLLEMSCDFFFFANKNFIDEHHSRFPLTDSLSLKIFFNGFYAFIKIFLLNYQSGEVCNLIVWDSIMQKDVL